MNSIGKTLILFGVVMIVVGGLFMLGAKVPWLGRLPGDIYVQKKNFSFFFPITTSILISVVISLILIFLRHKQ
ncbi:MAG: DUF2905 domain-containing protein [Candidatus Omnitrophota bacterium]